MGEEAWHKARLIPTSGISGAEERERRATSALLAVLTAVDGFSRAVLKPLGAPAGRVSAYIEVPFDLGEQKLFPDGLLRVKRGSREWTALVEVKTKDYTLKVDQIQNYLDIAKREGFDAVVTISNEMALLPTVHPTGIEGRKRRGIDLFHLSWTQVQTEAVRQKKNRGISDPEQAWILEELIRYLEHGNSGAVEFGDMGEHWVAVRNALQNGTFRTNDRGAKDVASRWSQLLQFISLQLGTAVGQDVEPVVPRDHLNNPEAYLSSMIDGLASSAVLRGSIRIPNTISPITLTADLRAGQISASIDIPAPQSARPLTKINWLKRQLTEASDGLRVDSCMANARGATHSELLKTVRSAPESLLDARKRDIKSFKVVMSAPMGGKRAGSRGGFVQSVTDLTNEFYRTVVSCVKVANTQPPPQRNAGTTIEPTDPASLSSAALSSQDGPESALAES